MEREWIATCAFGLEAIVKRELEALGLPVVRTENGKITFRGDARACVLANLHLRTADRILLKMGEFRAEQPDDLFLAVKAMPWEDLLPEDACFPVLASTVKSRLRSEPNNQKTVKKAIVMRLADAYGTQRLPETGAVYTVKVSLLKDVATITVDTSGESLHMRGYRTSPVAAPLKETLAAALVQLTFWHPDRLLIDPCCGSGTLAIEAAMIGRNIAPGISRHFAAEDWPLIPAALWKEERAAAFRAIDYDRPIEIRAFDIDPAAIRAAQENAEEAGVDDCITFERADIADTLADPAAFPASGILLSNPPYGERIGDRKTVDHIFRAFRTFLEARPDWSLFLLTPDRDAEDRILERPADRRRKLYNGRIEVCYYQFHGVRPRKD